MTDAAAAPAAADAASALAYHQQRTAAAHQIVLPILARAHNAGRRCVPLCPTSKKRFGLLARALCAPLFLGVH
jgi:hypothetical protein